MCQPLGCTLRATLARVFAFSRLLAAFAVAALLLVPDAADAKASPKPKAAAPPKRETGIASWFRTRKPLAGAHRTLPIGSKVRVRTKGGKTVVVTVTGRGPFVNGRVIDISSDAFKKLASLGTGLLKVTVERMK